MTVEVKSVDTQSLESGAEEATKVVVVVEEGGVKEVVEKKVEGEVVMEKSASFREESSISSDLKEFERKALVELKAKLEEAILENKIFKKKEIVEEKIEEKKEAVEEEEKKPDEEESEKSVEEEEKKPIEEESVEEAKAPIEEKVVEEVEVDKDIALWGVPLLPSKGDEGTDVVLLKFLRARDFKVGEAFEMLINTLQWRKEYKTDSLLEEDFSPELNSVAYMDGVDREGHPICFNVYGGYKNNELYQKTFGTEEQREQFLRWRVQLMEKGIQKLDFSPGGVCSILQINDLKNSPGPSKKELRIATKQAVGLLQDNYPEFVARNIFINVPFWYYAFNALLSPFLSQRTKSKFVFARAASVPETLLKYIPANEIPTKYGGLKRDNDTEFTTEEVSELVVKAGSTETIEIPTPEVGSTLLWDLTVLGWEVTYKEEFVPSDEGSYTIIIQKAKKVSSNEEPTRNSFTNNEAGKVVLTIENGSFKKKRVLYRYKIKKSSST